MKPTFKINASSLVRKHMEMKQTAAVKAKTAVTHIARNAVLFILANSPRDTNRFARAWALAMNHARLGDPVPVLKVRRSQFVEAANVEERMAEHLHRWQRTLVREKQKEVFWHGVFENRYNRVGRKGKWRDDALLRLKKAQWRVKRAQLLIKRISENLETLRNSGGNAVVIFGRKKQASKANLILGIEGVETPGAFDADIAQYQKRVEKAAFALAQVDRVISKVYGGTSEWVTVGDKVVVRLIVLEPHARIVDKKHRLVQRSMAVARRNRKKIVTEAFIRRTRKAAA